MDGSSPLEGGDFRFGLNMFTAMAFLVVYMPMEDFLLKFLPVPDAIFLALHFFSEFFIYCLFLLLLISKLGRHEKFLSGDIEGPLALFLAVVFASMLWNGVGLFDTAVHLRPVLRYVILFYIVININLNHTQIQVLIRLMLLSGAIQVLASLLQVIGGDAAKAFFMPRELADTGDIQVHQSRLLSQRGREEGSVFGTMGDTVILGDWLVVLATVFFAWVRRIGWAWIVSFVLLFLVVGLTYSRAALLCFLGLTMIWAWFSLGAGRVVVMAITGVLMLLLLIVGGNQQYVNPVFEEQSILQNMLGIFTEKYIKQSETNRLGALIGTLPTALMTNPVIGLGPDQETTIEQLNSSRHRTYLVKEMDVEGFKDVYWVAWVSFYGLFGLLALVWLYWKLFIKGMKLLNYSVFLEGRQMGLMMVMLILATSVLLFLNRAIEFRPYGFYFWMLVGLFMAHIRYVRIRLRAD